MLHVRVGEGGRAPCEHARRLGLDGDVGKEFLHELEAWTQSE